MVQVAEGADLLVDAFELVVRGSYAPEVQHAHVYEQRLAGRVGMDDPETEQVGSGIYAEYGLCLSQ